MKLNRFLLLFLPLAPLTANETEMVSIGYTVPTLFSLTLNPESITAPATTNADFDQGYLEMLGATTLTGAANTPFKTTIQAQDPELNASGKAVSDLQWRIGGGAYTPLSTTAETMHTIYQAIEPISVQMDLRLLLSWTEDGPGTYQATIILTMGPNV